MWYIELVYFFFTFGLCFFFDRDLCILLIDPAVGGPAALRGPAQHHALQGQQSTRGDASFPDFFLSFFYLFI